MKTRRKIPNTIHGDGGNTTPPRRTLRRTPRRTPRHTSHNQQQSMAAPFHQLHQVLRTLVFFCDGMSWSYILPGGPALLFRWFQPRTKIGSTVTGSSIGGSTTPPFESSSWSSRKVDWYDVYHYIESVIAVYVLGRCLGKVLCKRLPFLHSRATYPMQVTRVVTATLFVHVFAAGSLPERFTVVLRFVTAVLAGMLCGMTSIASLGAVVVHAVRNVSAATKTYWVGFATCVLLTSFVRAHRVIFVTPLSIGGVVVVAKLVSSPLFLTGLAEGAEIILRFLIAFTPEHRHHHHHHHHHHHRKTTSIPKQISTGSLHSLRRTARTKRDNYKTSLQNNRNASEEIQSMVHTKQQKQSSSAQETKPDLNNASTNSDHSSSESSTSAAGPDSYEGEICVYRDRRCVYRDGTPAYVPQGDCANQIPANFMEFYNYDRTRAQRAWEATQEWRRDNDVWRIHTLPNRWFPRIKEAYPHFVHGRSRTGYPIIYEQPGRMKLKELFRSGCQIEDMIFHYQFLMEFFSNVICTREDVRSSSDGGGGSSNASDETAGFGVMVVMDVQGFGLNNLSKDVLSYLKQAGEVNKAHYPLCTKRAFIVKASYFLAGAWTTLKGILPDTVQVDLLSESKYLNALREFIDDDQIPPEYGGTSPYRLGQHPYEISLRQLVEERLQEAG